MRTTATMSIMGLYNYDNSIFDKLQVPEAFYDDMTKTNVPAVDKDTLIGELLLQLAELEIVYTNPFFMKEAIGFWSNAHLNEWKKLSLASYVKYNPLHNYDRTETWDDTEDNSNSSTSSRNGTIKNTSDTKVAGFNSATLVKNGEGTDNGTSSESGSGSITEKKKANHSGRMYGNIGVTTNDKLLREFRDTAQFNIYQHIINQFKERFCVMVY